MKPLDLLTFPLHGLRLIEASAGTGKTYAIARLYLRLLLERALDVRDVLVVTFTRAATGELRGRILDVIREALHALESGEVADDALIAALLARCDDFENTKSRLRAALLSMDEASVFTIHGFCQRVLQEHALESGAPFEATFIESEDELLRVTVEDFWRRTFYPAESAGLAQLVDRAYEGPQALRLTIRDYLARSCEIVPRIEPETVTPAAYRAAREIMLSLWRTQQVVIKTLLNESKALGRSEKAYRSDRLEMAYAGLDAFAAAELLDYALPQPNFELFFPATLNGAVSEASRKKGLAAPVHRFFQVCQDLQGLCEGRLKLLLQEAISACRQDLRARKQAQNALAFDDLIEGLLTALCAESGAALAESLRRSYPVALIDEFQDTDPSQYRIFSRIYGDAPDCGLFMIGDPKQAIYGFRGGDIYTYLQARQETAGEGGHYTLDTNWRATGKLVEAVNRLFRGARAPFLYPGEIDFHPVKAAGQAERDPYTEHGLTLPPLCLWYVQKSAENAGRGKLTNPIAKEKAREVIAQAVAGEVVRLLGGAARIGARPVRAGDVAVLVRNRFEAAEIRAALRRRGLGSVFLSQDSVFATPEAAELQAVLAAVADPLDGALLRIALASSLMGLDAAALERLAHDEAEWERRRTDFLRYQSLWRRHGFMAMFQEWLADASAPARLLAGADGERRLTDLLHLAELVQAESSRLSGPESLIRWLADQCRQPDGRAEGQQVRLESDERLVQVVTIHKSKGLEYPVVFLPTAWESRPHDGRPPFLFHSINDRALCLDLGSEPAGTNQPLADRERLAEELRLLYVALTRAKQRCYVIFGDIGEARFGPLSYLLYQEAAMTDPVAETPAHFAALDETARRARLQELAARSEGAITLADLPQISEIDESVFTPPVSGSSRGARVFRGHLDTSWRVASYTALASQGRLDTQSDYDAVASGPIDSGDARRDRFGFPRGGRSGRMLHELLEHLDFASTSGGVLEEEAARSLRKYGMDEAYWSLPVAQWLTDVLETPLDEQGFTLRDVTTACRLNELEFHYPLTSHLPAAGLQGILRRLADYRTDSPALRFEPTRGIMHGYIDLVFEHRGRYFLADYKSNYLGSTFDAYVSDPSLVQAMNGHRYDLQYLLYTLALHRYLRWRLGARYDYARHFGGVYYLFLRGMTAANAGRSGVYRTRPDPELVEALDRLLSAET